MRLGIYLPGDSQSLGGTFTLERSIIQGLLEVDTHHELYAIATSSREGRHPKGVHWVSLDEEPQPARSAWQVFAQFCRRIRHGRRLDYIQKQINMLNPAINIRAPLNRTLSRHRIDLLWFTGPVVQPADVPYICTVWDLAHRVTPFFPEVNYAGEWEARERLYTWSLRKAVYVLTGTEAGKREIIQFYQVPQERVKVIPYPTPAFITESVVAVDVREKYGIRGPYLLYPAQFWPHKNHVTLLLAAKMLKEIHGLDFSLIFTGSDYGNRAYIEKKALELGLGNQLHILGFVPIEDLHALYRNALALTFPTYFGPDNLPPLEAFALGCPVIASRVSGAEEQLGDAALLFDPANKDELAEAIKRVSDSRDLRDTLIQRGRKRAQMFSSLDYVSSVLKLVDEFEPMRRCWSSEEIFRCVIPLLVHFVPFVCFVD